MHEPNFVRAAGGVVFRVRVLALGLAFAFAACGGGGDERVTDTSATASTGDQTGSTSGDNSGTTGTSATTLGADRVRRARPARGPTDVVFPLREDAPDPYELVADGRCEELALEVSGWEDVGVASKEGQDTIELYRSAAHACLGEWDLAIEAFGRISAPIDFAGRCSREALFAWLADLIAERQSDPAFEPEFVDSSAPSPCPAEDATDGDTTDGDTTDGDTTDEDTTDGDTTDGDTTDGDTTDGEG